MRNARFCALPAGYELRNSLGRFSSSLPNGLAQMTKAITIARHTYCTSSSVPSFASLDGTASTHLSTHIFPFGVGQRSRASLHSLRHSARSLTTGFIPSSTDHPKGSSSDHEVGSEDENTAHDRIVEEKDLTRAAPPCTPSSVFCTSPPLLSPSHSPLLLPPMPPRLLLLPLSHSKAHQRGTPTAKTSAKKMPFSRGAGGFRIARKTGLRKPKAGHRGGKRGAKKGTPKRSITAARSSRATHRRAPIAFKRWPTGLRKSTNAKNQRGRGTGRGRRTSISARTRSKNVSRKPRTPKSGVRRAQKQGRRAPAPSSARRSSSLPRRSSPSSLGRSAKTTTEFVAWGKTRPQRGRRQPAVTSLPLSRADRAALVHSYNAEVNAFVSSGPCDPVAFLKSKEGESLEKEKPGTTATTTAPIPGSPTVPYKRYFIGADTKQKDTIKANAGRSAAQKRISLYSSSNGSATGQSSPLHFTMMMRMIDEKKGLSVVKK